MERILDSVNSILNTYYRTNVQRGNEKQTSLQEIKALVSEKWNDVCNTWIPKFSEECPGNAKCYKDEFPSFKDALVIENTPNINIQYQEEVEQNYIEQGDVETLDVDVPQKRL